MGVGRVKPLDDLDGRWHTFDARNNIPRIGRVVVGRGRDAVDVALITSFGPLTLVAVAGHHHSLM